MMVGLRAAIDGLTDLSGAAELQIKPEWKFAVHPIFWWDGDKWTDSGYDTDSQSRA
jgi:hypothetical protein